MEYTTPLCGRLVFNKKFFSLSFVHRLTTSWAGKTRYCVFVCLCMCSILSCEKIIQTSQFNRIVHRFNLKNSNCINYNDGIRWCKSESSDSPFLFCSSFFLSYVLHCVGPSQLHRHSAEHIAWQSFFSFQVPSTANAVNSAADGKTFDVVVVGACIVDNIR